MTANLDVHDKYARDLDESQLRKEIARLDRALYRTKDLLLLYEEALTEANIKLPEEKEDVLRPNE